MTSLSSPANLSSRHSTRRDWLRRAAAGAILVAALAAFVSEERSGGVDVTAQRLGILGGAGSPGPGQPAPDFVLEEQGTGQLVRLSDYRGRAVVLNFWATWCPPCIAEMPELSALQTAHVAADDLVVLAVNVEEPPAAVEEFRAQVPLSMPVLSDRTGEVRRHYGIPGLPGTFFIDDGGIVRAKTLGPVTGKPLADGLAAVDRR